VDSVGVGPCRNVQMQTYLLLLGSFLSSCVKQFLVSGSS
jgi:hypothetical protein